MYLLEDSTARSTDNILKGAICNVFDTISPSIFCLLIFTFYTRNSDILKPQDC